MREMNRLSARAVATLTKPGRHADGGGLYLSIGADGVRKRWVFFYEKAGRQREMGLGPIADVSLKEARDKADDARALLKAGKDPLEERRAAEAAREAERARPTFGAFADELVDSIEGGFRNQKHRDQWRMTLGDAYCEKLRKKRLDEIETADVLMVLQPVWLKKNETASRIRGRIERVLDAARAKGLRTGENPARWRGHLDALLPRRQKLQRGHHKALGYEEVSNFVALLRGGNSVGARAFEFLILTAVRSGEVREATWGEIAIGAALWTIPAARMKAKKEHRVPLQARALAILEEMARLRKTDQSDELIFPGARAGKLSVMVFDMTMRREEVDATPHGFRSAFRDWCAEETSFPREIAEQALAHTVGSEVERAYRRGDALEKRRALMDAWANFVEPKQKDAKVVPLRRKGGNGK